MNTLNSKTLHTMRLYHRFFRLFSMNQIDTDRYFIACIYKYKYIDKTFCMSKTEWVKKKFRMLNIPDFIHEKSQNKNEETNKQTNLSSHGKVIKNKNKKSQRWCVHVHYHVSVFISFYWSHECKCIVNSIYIIILCSLNFFSVNV